MPDNYSMFKIPGFTKNIGGNAPTPEHFETLNLQTTGAPQSAPVDQNLAIYQELTSIAEEIVKCRELKSLI